MSDEELERRMEFIVSQQAQFSVDIQRLRESQARTEQLVNRLAAATLEGFRDVKAKMDALVDSQLRTEENIRNLTAVVDRHSRERGGAEG